MDAIERQERLIEAAAALLEAAPGQRLQITNLNKALFYLDLTTLRDEGRTLTGCTYVAFENGPVVDRYKTELVGQLESRGLAKEDPEGLSKPLALTKPVTTFRYMDDYHRGLAGKVARHIAGYSAGAVSDFAHRNPGWIAARKRGEREPIDMVAAMQQVVDQDPWLMEELTPAEQRALAAATEQSSPW